VLLTAPEVGITNGLTSAKSVVQITNARSVHYLFNQSPHPAHSTALLAGIINGQNYKLVGAGNSSLSPPVARAIRSAPTKASTSRRCNFGARWIQSVKPEAGCFFPCACRCGGGAQIKPLSIIRGEAKNG